VRSLELEKLRNRVLRELKELARKLNATVYLFGSFARGDFTRDSDVDIVVVSEIFEGKSLPDRVSLVRLLLPSDLDFEIVPLTPRELERKLSSSFFREISRYWIEIKPEDC